MVVFIPAQNVAYLMGKLVGILGPVELFSGQFYEVFAILSLFEEDNGSMRSLADQDLGLPEVDHVPEQLVRS